MKSKIYLFIILAILASTYFLASSSALDPYARRIRPFNAVPGTCIENEVGYSMTLHNFYICTNTGYKILALSTTVAPITATYITQTPDATLTNEQALSALATGIVKNTTTTGVLSIAAAGTDYQVPITAGDVTTSGATSTIGASKVTNGMLAGSIAYSKLSLTGAILNADLAGSIAYSKLNLTGAILNADLAGSIAYSKLSLTNSIVSGDIVSLVWSKITSTPTTFAGYGISDTSANFFSAITNETGSGLVVGNTSPTFATNITVPAILGGSAVGSQLNLTGTSAAGTSTVAAVQILVGSNGGTNSALFYNNGNIVFGGGSTAAFDSNSPKYITFDTASSTVLEMGLGSTQTGTSANLAHIAFINTNLGGADKRNALIQVQNDGATNSGTMKFYAANAGTLNQYFSFDHSGNIGFNTTVYNTCTGLTTASGIVQCTVSDESVKEDITTFKESGLDIIDRIHPITFEYKKGTPWFKDRVELGFSAQNLRKANPLLASYTNNKDNLLQPEPLAIQSVEVQAIKELKNLVIEQQKQINELRKEIKRRK
jgi:hypothetical protein